jgi:hypothetical protein
MEYSSLIVWAILAVIVLSVSLPVPKVTEMKSGFTPCNPSKVS